MAEHRDVEPKLVNPEVRYERQDVGIRWMIIGGTSIFILALIGLGMSAWILGTMETRRSEIIPTPLPLLDLRPTPPAPRLQPNVLDRQSAEEDMISLREREEELLTTYGWVNREAGIVRIPIDEAIELLAEDGTVEPER